MRDALGVGRAFSILVRKGRIEADGHEVPDPGAMNAVYGPYSNALRSPLPRQEADGTVTAKCRGFSSS